MKIRIGKTPKCVTFRVETADGWCNTFYMTVEELDDVIAKGGLGCYDDCGNIMQARSNLLAFVESPKCHSRQSGAARYVWFDMDTAKFFGTVKQLLAINVVNENDRHWVESESFRFRPDDSPVRNWAQLLRHERFMPDARKKLKEALEVASRFSLMELRDTLNRLINQGKVIHSDFAKASFYFGHAEGRGYNGGVIWHGSSWSVHT